MKVTAIEYETNFGVILHAETMVDMAALVRLGMNTTKEKVYKQTDVYKDGTATLTIMFDKRKNSNSGVPTRG